MPRYSVPRSALAGALLTAALLAARRRPRPPADRAVAGQAVEDLLRGERRRQEDLAARLHDGPLQGVIAARQDLQEHLAGEDVDLRETIEALDEAVAALRDLNTDLYDAVLRDSGLEAALRQAADATERRGGPPIAVSVGPGASGPHDALLVRVANELLTNVRKHAGAQRARVLLVRGEHGRVHLSVTDDGVGMDPEVLSDAALEGHLGLRSITRRIADAGGTVRVRPLAPGAEVEVRLPGAV
ncbi:sensor histidine kinase [Patulibacter sp.]|uniref:sensor histidine kinase n=1 Tax=Patulibacter sp. TaxID=1912859 RepID=UPI002718F5D5|nr:ATP-binding protein [Patulibacter sp.]MDO9407901.1 hypothetical protein [Patulibacter sp.]